MAGAIRYGLVAGNGSLPVAVAERLAAQGHSPLVARIAGEADPVLARFDGDEFTLERIASVVPAMSNAGVTHAIMAGGVRRRPRIADLRVPRALWLDLVQVVPGLRSGDNALLTVLVRVFERHGMAVVGAHTVLPDHVASVGQIGACAPRASDNAAADAAIAAARAIGTLDIGQAVVAVGTRIVAVEGVEGTDAMLARVRQLREDGRVDASRPAVLAKMLKPNQDARADMPTIGPHTIANAAAAGVRRICISADGTLIMNVADTIRLADEAGIALVGVGEAGS